MGKRTRGASDPGMDASHPILLSVQPETYHRQAAPSEPRSRPSKSVLNLLVRPFAPIRVLTRRPSNKASHSRRAITALGSERELVTVLASASGLRPPSSLGPGSVTLKRAAGLHDLGLGAPRQLSRFARCLDTGGRVRANTEDDGRVYDFSLFPC